MLEALTTPEGIDSQAVVSQQVFHTMAGMDVSPSFYAPIELDRTVDSVLCYRGACEGTLVIECSTAVAFAFAEHFMNIPMPSSCNDDVMDAMAELVNMIGGNLKALLPAETSISMPTVFPPGSAKERMADGSRLSCIEFISECGPFRISLYGRN